jgi:catecholate siderophore receptor
VPISAFYGDPKESRVRSDVNLLNASVERLFGSVIFRNRTLYGAYDRFYQNFVPGAANATGTLVALSAYNNATARKNLFNQTDLTVSFSTGGVRHTLIGGSEFGRQVTDNFRRTGFFNNTSTSIQVPFSDPLSTVPVTFRQSATDANNHLRLRLGAAFVQDQIEFTRWLQAIVGIRFDHFGLKYRNIRNGETLSRVDRLISPRFGLVLKPVRELSLYGSYSVSQLPSSGDQFSSLTVITQQVKPERFTNYEAGLKWDIRPGLFFTAAAYRLDRTNTRATDPNDASRIIQTGKQRTEGFEAGVSGNVTGAWSMTGGYSWQNARITSATASAAAGKRVAQVPRNLFSWWNRYQITSRLGAGIGLIYRSEMFAAIDKTVVLPGYLKADGAIFYTINEHWRLQANVENITNKRYFVNADNNTNISPGSPRAVKVGLTARF